MANDVTNEESHKIPQLMEAELIAFFLHNWKIAEEQRGYRKRKELDADPDAIGKPFGQYWVPSFRDWMKDTPPEIVDALVTPLFLDSLLLANEYERMFNVAIRYTPQGGFEDVIEMILITINSLNDSRRKLWERQTTADKERILNVLGILE